MKTQNLSQTTWFTILMLFVFFPVGIYLIWKNKKFKHNSRVIIATFFLAGCIISFTGCDTDTQTSIPNELTQVDETQTESKTLALTDNEKKNTYVTNGESFQYEGKSYKIIEVDGGDLSGNREPNVAVDIGFGDREYWALTNEYGQLVYVMADKIVLQDDENEPVTSKGRYYSDEAKVPGVERADLDEGHIIADSLGGVSNAYNITPQNSTLNRHGDQAYLEKVIRDAGGCENFVATITYPNTETQIPLKYKYQYTLNGNEIVDEFDNVDPDEVNSTINSQKNTSTNTSSDDKASTNEKEELSKVDTNGDGKVTIAEAKAAGYRMPIYSDHWLYEYMDDRDGDGMVGE